MNEDIKARLVSRLRTDSGNGERLVLLHGNDLRYLPKAESWWCWDGARWARDETLHVRRCAKGTIRAFGKAAMDLAADNSDVLLKFAAASESDAKLNAMIRCAASEPGMAVTYQMFDSNHMLLNVANGVVDLSNGEFSPHDRDLLMTKLAPVSYDPAAQCPRWMRFIEEVFCGDVDLMAYIQRAAGYTLTGDTREECFHLLYGTGSNGKSTLVETLALLMGDYSLKSDTSSFLDNKPQQGGSARSDLARLAGARFIRASETGEGRRLDQEVIKALTGNERISARYQFEREFEFEPTFKIWLSTNHKPVIRGTDFGIWRRVRTIPFHAQFTGANKEDTSVLRSTLRAELPGILNWAIAGCLLWLEKGLNPPESVLVANAEYREESDTFGVFLDDCCELRDSYEIRVSELYAAYKKWAEDGGEYVMGQTAFGRRLKDRGFDVRKSNGVKLRAGLRLRPELNNDSRELF